MASIGGSPEFSGDYSVDPAEPFLLHRVDPEKGGPRKLGENLLKCREVAGTHPRRNDQTTFRWNHFRIVERPRVYRD